MRERSSAFMKRVPLILLLAASACVLAPLLLASNGVAYALGWAAPFCNVLVAIFLFRAAPSLSNHSSDSDASTLDPHFFDEIVQNTSDLVGIATLDGKVEYLNSAGRAMLGFGLQEDIRGRSILEFYPSWAARLVQE